MAVALNLRLSNCRWMDAIDKRTVYRHHHTMYNAMMAEGHNKTTMTAERTGLTERKTSSIGFEFIFDVVEITAALQKRIWYPVCYPLQLELLSRETKAFIASNVFVYSRPSISSSRITCDWHALCRCVCFWGANALFGCATNDIVCIFFFSCLAGSTRFYLLSFLVLAFHASWFLLRKMHSGCPDDEYQWQRARKGKADYSPHCDYNGRPGLLAHTHFHFNAGRLAAGQPRWENLQAGK